MEWGSQRKRLEEIEEETGDKPDALEKRPQLLLSSHAMVFSCFMTLHMMRTGNGFGVNPITMQMMNDYEVRFGKLPVDDDLLVRLIKQCDEAALEWLRDKDKKPKG